MQVDRPTWYLLPRLLYGWSLLDHRARFQVGIVFCEYPFRGRYETTGRNHMHRASDMEQNEIAIGC